MQPTPKSPPSATGDLAGTLTVMGFAAVDNLRGVVLALARRDPAGLAHVAERNAKQARLRAEIEEQARAAVRDGGSREQRRMALVRQAAGLFESMGGATVEIAGCAEALLRSPRPSRIVELKKLLEHAVYLVDRAAIALMEEKPELARVAEAQVRFARDLYGQMQRERDGRALTDEEAMERFRLLTQMTARAFGIIEEAGRFAQDVLAFLESR